MFPLTIDVLIHSDESKHYITIIAWALSLVSAYAAPFIAHKICAVHEPLSLLIHLSIDIQEGHTLAVLVMFRPTVWS